MGSKVTPDALALEPLASHAWAPARHLGVHLLVLLLLLTQIISPYEVLVIYWFELAILGCAALLKLFAAMLLGEPFENEWVESSFGATLLFGGMAAGFFVVKFGALLFGLGIVLVMLPVSELSAGFELGSIGPWMELCLWYLLANQLFEFVWGFLRQRQYLEVSVPKLLFAPYVRAWVIGLTLVLACGASHYFSGHAYSAFCAVLVLVNGLLTLRKS